jgi:phenylacetate-CoA ligase
MHPTPTPTRAQLEAGQLQQLRRLLAALRPANRFYEPVLAAARVDSSLDSLDAFRRRVPFTTKQQVAADQIDHPPYGTNLSFPLASFSRFHQTSGTTAAPIRWLDTPQSWQWMLDNWKRVYHAAGVDADDRVYFAFSFGPFLGFWTAFEAAAQVGALCIPGGGLGSLARLRALLDNRATVLCCTPTYALHLAEVAAENKIDLAADATIRAIIVAGEPGGSLPAIRKQISRRWPGATLFDHHGMTEVGPVSYPCPHLPGVLHVIESSYLAEVIDPQSTQPTPPGELGELVLTTLGRLGSPLLRYRTGDLVRVHSAGTCPCGAGDAALLGGILGRTDDMAVVRGVNVYPGAIDQIVRSVPGIAEYRVDLDSSSSMPQLSLAIEPAPDRRGDTSLVSALQSALRDALTLRVPVTLLEPGSLPRFEMKADRWHRR